MKLFLSVLSMVLVAAAISPAAADPSALIGSYDGVIFSAGNKQGTTNFALSASNKVVGSYEFGANEKREVGTLSRCKLKNTQLKCKWADAFGVGTLTMRFSANFCSFNGIWFQKGDRTKTERHWPWTGRRVGCAGLSS